MLNSMLSVLFLQRETLGKIDVNKEVNIKKYQWLDDVATQLGLQHSFAVAFNGH